MPLAASAPGLLELGQAARDIEIADGSPLSEATDRDRQLTKFHLPQQLDVQAEQVIISLSLKIMSLCRLCRPTSTSLRCHDIFCGEGVWGKLGAGPAISSFLSTLDCVDQNHSLML